MSCTSCASLGDTVSQMPSPPVSRPRIPCAIRSFTAASPRTVSGPFVARVRRSCASLSLSSESLSDPLLEESLSELESELDSESALSCRTLRGAAVGVDVKAGGAFAFTTGAAISAGSASSTTDISLSSSSSSSSSSSLLPKSKAEVCCLEKSRISTYSLRTGIILRGFHFEKRLIPTHLIVFQR